MILIAWTRLILACCKRQALGDATVIANPCELLYLPVAHLDSIDALAPPLSVPHTFVPSASPTASHQTRWPTCRCRRRAPLPAATLFKAPAHRAKAHQICVPTPTRQAGQRWHDDRLVASPPLRILRAQRGRLSAICALRHTCSTVSDVHGIALLTRRSKVASRDALYRSHNLAPCLDTGVWSCGPCRLKQMIMLALAVALASA